MLAHSRDLSETAETLLAVAMLRSIDFVVSIVIDPGSRAPWRNFCITVIRLRLR